MVTSDNMRRVLVAIRNAAEGDVPQQIGADDSLVLHLGFDSVKMALLSLSLEREFGFALALDGWIASHPDPYDLTVRSLCDYVEEGLRFDAAPAISA